MQQKYAKHRTWSAGGVLGR